MAHLGGLRESSSARAWARCAGSRSRGGSIPRAAAGELSVRRRRGGETLKPGPRAHPERAAPVSVDGRAALDARCAAHGVRGDTLIAVGDLWQDARWCVARDARDSAAFGRMRRLLFKWIVAGGPIC
jgi:hypothetical protein